MRLQRFSGWSARFSLDVNPSLLHILMTSWSFSRNETEHQAISRCRFPVFGACHNLRIKLKKCSFFQKQMPFLGYVLSQGQVQVEPEKVEAL